MSVYSIEFKVNEYRILVPANPDDFDGGNLWINGALKLSSWHPPKMRWSDEEEGVQVPDIAYISPGFYAFNERATEVLGDLLAEYGELLDLPVEGEQWTAFNPTTEIDCLDQERSEWRIRRSGEKGRLIKPVFLEDKIQGQVIFQIPEKITSAFYVTDAFVERVVAHQLTGLDFHRC